MSTTSERNSFSKELGVLIIDPDSQDKMIAQAVRNAFVANDGNSFTVSLIMHDEKVMRDEYQYRNSLANICLFCVKGFLLIAVGMIIISLLTLSPKLWHFIVAGISLCFGVLSSCLYFSFKKELQRLVPFIMSNGGYKVYGGG